MRKKLLSKTYLRDVNSYDMKIDYSNDDFWYSVKYIKDTVPFVISTGKTLIDNNYYLLELVPKNKNYSMRVFFNEKKELLQYYFDISLGNGLDEKSKIPYYDDAYNDIIITDDEIELADEDELESAYKNNKISKKDYELVRKTTKELYEEIISKNNIYMNKNLEELL